MIKRRVIELTSTIIPNPRGQNKRFAYVLAVVMTIIFGLASRKFGHLLPPFVAENAGDMLWAMMVYFGFRFLLVRKNMLTAICLSFLFSFAIEFSQLYQADWINQLRATVLGALVLGKGYLTVDLIRYITGIIFATALDRTMINFTPVQK
jgi:glycopeptide antibiotics resistance protein